jgi:hypothetical protein
VGDRVADEVLGSLGDDEDAIKGTMEFTIAGGATEDGAELLTAGTGVTGDEEAAVLPVEVLAIGVAEDWEQGLATVVVQHELVSRGGTAPALADGAAAEDVLGR